MAILEAIFALSSNMLAEIRVTLPYSTKFVKGAFVFMRQKLAKNQRKL